MLALVFDDTRDRNPLIKGEDLSYQLWIIQPIVTAVMALPLLVIPPNIAGLPLGNYGISYDNPCAGPRMTSRMVGILIGASLHLT